MMEKIDQISAGVEAACRESDVTGLASMAMRFARRAEALGRAVDAAATTGIPRDNLHAWMTANGWELRSSDEIAFEWTRGNDEFVTFGDYTGLIVLMRDVKALAEIHGRPLTDVAEEIMAAS